MGSRRKARECALQVLYQIDISGAAPEDALNSFWQNFEYAPDIAEFAANLVRGVILHRDAIDHLIQDSSRNWKLDRMARVDRNILRMAVFELLHRPEIPKKVTLNEAIEIAKRYGSEDSSAFINGILDHICASIAKE
jgi:N utilization substance protein B